MSDNSAKAQEPPVFSTRRHSDTVDASEFSLPDINEQLKNRLESRPSREELQLKHVWLSPEEAAAEEQSRMDAMKTLDGKIARRPSRDVLEERNVLKTSRLRHDSIDFPGAGAQVSLLLKKRLSGEAPKKDLSELVVSVEHEEPELMAVDAVRLPRGRLVAPSSPAIRGRDASMSPHSPINKPGRQRAVSSGVKSSSTHSRDRSDPPLLAASSTIDEERSAGITNDPSELLRVADVLCSRGVMDEETNDRVANLLRAGKLPEAMTIVQTARMALGGSEDAESGGVDRVVTRRKMSGRRNTIAVPQSYRMRVKSGDTLTRSSTTSKHPKIEQDDEELRLVFKTQLILERVELEKSLDSGLLNMVRQAIGNLKTLTNMYNLHASHIARRIHKRFSVAERDDEDDAEIVHWISQNYMNTASTSGLQPISLRDADSPTIENQRRVFLERNLQPSAVGVPHGNAMRVKSSVDVVDQLLRKQEVTEALSLYFDWNFDVFRLQEVTDGKALVVSAAFCLRESGLQERFCIPRHKIASFFTDVQRNYRANPFHNDLHATDVTQGLYFFLCSDAMRTLLSSLDQLSAIVAAFVHDLAHVGTTNAFQVATESQLALRYNDQSVLENHHLATAFKLLKKSDNDIFCHLSKPERREVRDNIVSMVLATDMKLHVQQVAELEASIQKKHSQSTWFSCDDKDERRLLLNMALHCADLSNPCRPRYLYVSWVDRLMEEFFAQGDKERDLDIPISPMMDRHKPAIERSQVGFIEYVIRPLYVLWHQVVPDCNVCLKHLAANHEYYVGQIPRVGQAAISKAQQVRVAKRTRDKRKATLK